MLARYHGNTFSRHEAFSQLRRAGAWPSSRLGTSEAPCAPFPGNFGILPARWIPTSNTCRRTRSMVASRRTPSKPAPAQVEPRARPPIPPSAASHSRPASPQNGKETSGAGLVAQLSDATFLKAKVRGPPPRAAGTPALHDSMSVSCGLPTSQARRAFLGLVLILFVRSVISGVLNQPSSADRDLTRAPAPYLRPSH